MAMTLRDLIYQVTQNMPLDEYLRNFEILDYEIVPAAELCLGYKRLVEVKVSEKNKSIVLIHEGN